MSQRAQVLPTHSTALFEAAVRRATELLRAGEIVALPTETVYGLAANALSAEAVSRIFSIKGRPPQNPIIVHVAGVEMAKRCVSRWTELADKLAAAFWPGPLTLVLLRSPEIPDIVAAGGPTVGVRWPKHPLTQAIIQACGFPLAAPSANPSMALSPTTAEHVRAKLGDKIPLILDGGPARVGIESTVLDLSVSPPELLRPGMIDANALVAVTGELSIRESHGAGPLRSPGRLRKHYAPGARIVVWSWADDAALKRELSRLELPVKSVHVIAHTKIPAKEDYGGVSVLPQDAERFGSQFYGELHRADQAGTALIVVEALPSGPEWDAIADRLRRATA